MTKETEDIIFLVEELIKSKKENIKNGDIIDKTMNEKSVDLLIFLKNAIQTKYPPKKVLTKKEVVKK